MAIFSHLEWQSQRYLTVQVVSFDTIDTLIDSARSTFRHSMALLYDCVPKESRMRSVTLFCIME